MDGQRFDELTRALATGVSRRGVLRGLGGGLAALAAAALGRGADAAPKYKRCNVGCAGLKGQQKNACMKACRQCGGDFDRVCPEFGPFGPVAFTCCPEGTACDQFTGECIELTICPTGEPAENCAAGVFTDCGAGGGCALVDDADGDDCQCVERACTGIPCASDADCAEFGLLCVTIPGCCPETTFCGIPCGQGGGGAAARRQGARWRR